MLSQATVQDACLLTIDEMRAKRTYNYVIFKLTDDQKQIIVDKAEVTTNYTQFLDALPKEVPRYAICEFPFTDQEGYLQVAFIYYVWLADDANIGLKLKYLNNSDALRRKLAGISVEIEANKVDDIAKDTVLRLLKRGLITHYIIHLARHCSRAHVLHIQKEPNRCRGLDTVHSMKNRVGVPHLAGMNSFSACTRITFRTHQQSCKQANGA